jgi:hypothetical protein
MRIIPPLTSSNCFMLVLHTMNIRLMLDGLKCEEGRNRMSSRCWIIFVSARKDTAGHLGWVSDPGIKLGYMYVVAYITAYEEGVDYTYSWQLEVYPIPCPVACPPVGQGPQSPRAAHTTALAALVAQLDAMNSRGCMSRVWRFGGEPTAFQNVLGTFCIPTDIVQCYTSAQHKGWDYMCSTGDIMWYHLIAQDPAASWGYPEGVDYIQVKVLAHMYLEKQPVSVYVCLCVRIIKGQKHFFLQDGSPNNSAARMRTLVKTLGKVRAFLATVCAHARHYSARMQARTRSRCFTS